MQLLFPAHLQVPLAKFFPKKRPTIACMAVFASWLTFLSLSFAKSLFYTLFSFFTVKQPCQFHGFFAIALRDSIFLFLFSFLFSLFLSYPIVPLFVLPILVSSFFHSVPQIFGYPIPFACVAAYAGSMLLVFALFPFVCSFFSCFPCVLSSRLPKVS